MMNQYQEYIHQSRYARFRDDLGGRETWDETVDRVGHFFATYVLKDKKKLLGELAECMDAVRKQEIMPSMRVMMTAGKALADHHVAAYNCAYTPIDHPRKFSEILYILMCGTGVGFSVERNYVHKLPDVPEVMFDSESVIKVRDSKLGWAVAYRELIQMLYGGRIPEWDMSKVRPAGSRLMTFGGRASGPEPLDSLFKFTIDTFKKAVGRKLTTLEVHDIVCKIADIVVVGGVRRSALISLSNLSDDRLRHAKTGNWFETNGYRALSNNSVAYTTRPDMDSYLREMSSLYESKSGERGVFSRAAAKKKYEDHRRDNEFEFGCNPCSEILLRPDEFCNLTEVIVRASDTHEDLKRKIRQATFLGTLQATLTDFKFLSKAWRENCEEERLLGVSLTGIMDHPDLNGKGFSITKWDDLVSRLRELRDEAITANVRAAKALGIPASAAITCVKPSGTVSQLCDTASGIHPRYAPFYLRRVRTDSKDPVCQFMKDSGFMWEEEVGNPHVTVFTFPIKSPDNAVTKDEVSALDQLKLWSIYNKHFCEHKPSITVYYTEEEFLRMASYVYDNFDEMSGVSFLPTGDDHIYAQAPYEEIDQGRYEEEAQKLPASLDWKMLSVYENSDNTTVQPELQCTGGACEL